MNLQQYQDLMMDVIQGRGAPEAAAAQLWGSFEARDVVRLEGYRKGTIGATGEGLEIQHPQTARVIRERLGAGAWWRVVSAYVDAHLPSHPHRLAGFEPFPAFLATREELPTWMAELASLERAALLASMAPDQPDASVELDTAVLHLQWDVLGWNNDCDPDWAADPEPRPCRVLTWRGPEGTPLQAEVGPLEEAVLEARRQGRGLSEAEREALGCGTEDEDEATVALVEIEAIRPV